MNVRFYLDENVSPALAEQLRRRGIEAVTVRDLGLLGDSDLNHLQRATAFGFVLCTHDSDYVELALSGLPHAGIVFAQQATATLGDWVRFLSLIHGVYEAHEMVNLIEYLR
jgi:predicted nuclease of predicted toxin-antitoxin system